MTRRTNGTCAAVLLTGLLAGLLSGCGSTDAETNEARAVAELSASPAPSPTMTFRPCPGGEIYRADPSGAMQTIKPDCFDQAVAEAIKEFPEPLPAGTGWDIRIPDFTDPQQNPDLHQPVIEDGGQDTMVANFWLCAWLETYVQALDHQDPAGQADSMAHLSRYTALPAIQAHMANPEIFDASVIEPAKAGDPTRLREFAKSCSN